MTEARVETIRKLLTDGLAPVHLDIIDESHLHAGHAGAASGGGHFRVTVVSDKFDNESLIARHRLIYSTLGDMMQTDIHALSITAVTAEEHSS